MIYLKASDFEFSESSVSQFTLGCLHDMKEKFPHSVAGRYCAFKALISKNDAYNAHKRRLLKSPELKEANIGKFIRYQNAALNRLIDASIKDSQISKANAVFLRETLPGLKTHLAVEIANRLVQK